MLCSFPFDTGPEDRYVNVTSTSWAAVERTQCQPRHGGDSGARRRKPHFPVERPGVADGRSRAGHSPLRGIHPCLREGRPMSMHGHVLGPRNPFRAPGSALGRRPCWVHVKVAVNRLTVNPEAHQIMERTASVARKNHSFCHTAQLRSGGWSPVSGTLGYSLARTQEPDVRWRGRLLACFASGESGCGLKAAFSFLFAVLRSVRDRSKHTSHYAPTSLRAGGGKLLDRAPPSLISVNNFSSPA